MERERHSGRRKAALRPVRLACIQFSLCSHCAFTPKCFTAAGECVGVEVEGCRAVREEGTARQKENYIPKREEDENRKSNTLQHYRTSNEMRKLLALKMPDGKVL